MVPLSCKPGSHNVPGVMQDSVALLPKTSFQFGIASFYDNQSLAG